MRISAALRFCLMARAQTTPVKVDFTLLDAKDPYKTPYPPLPGATVRLVLGESANWQNPDAGHKFVTDEKGEAHFTMDAQIDPRWIWRNVGFTPIGVPVRSEHLKIGVELEHALQQKTFRWMLTMDLDCVKRGPCSTVGFMGIYPPDAQGRFTKALVRQGGTESWKVPGLNDKVISGMSYEVADFLMTADENDPAKRTLQLAIKRLPRK